MIYIIVLFISILLLSLTQKSNKKNVKNFGYFITFLICFLPHGLRYGIGTDYFYTYVPYYNFISNGTRQFQEPLFNALNLIIYRLFDDYAVLFFICSFLFFVFLFYTIYKKSYNTISSVALIILSQAYFYSMNMVRQSIAISLVLFIFLAIGYKKEIKKVIMIIISSLIHLSSIYMIPFIFLSKKKYTAKFKIIIVILCEIFNAFFSNFIINFIAKYTNYSWYLDSRYLGLDVSLTLVIFNVVLFLISLKYSKYEENDNTLRICSNMSFFGLCVLSFASIPLINRLVRYFTIFQIILIPNMLSYEKSKKKVFLFKVLIYGILTFSVINQIFIKGGEQVLPYVSIFER